MEKILLPDYVVKLLDDIVVDRYDFQPESLTSYSRSSIIAELAAEEFLKIQLKKS